MLVAASSNHAKKEGRAISRYPALFGNPDDKYGTLDSLITVGAVDEKTFQAGFSQYADWMTTFAPGDEVYIPDNPNNGNTNKMTKGGGTSYGKFR